jgi:trk system potassium uptake protein TrkH
MLMFIGGSPGSTAGGIKTTTFAVLILTTLASTKREQNVTVFRRRFDNDTLIQASAIFTIYGCLLLTGVLIIAAIEPFSLTEIMFEATSAIGTVGLTLGITPKLCAVSKCILILLMFAGRVGGLSFMLVLGERRRTVPISRPTGQILIG